MRLTKAQLRERKIHNAYNLAKVQIEPKVFIPYSPQEIGMASQFAKWQVYRIGWKTDPEAHWTNDGQKTFNVFRPATPEKEEQRLAAISWATEKYGISEWERSPFGSYHPVGTLAKAAAITP